MRRKALPVHPGEILLEEFLTPSSERFWLNLQTAYDLDVERDRLGTRLAKEVAVLPKAG